MYCNFHTGQEPDMESRDTVKIRAFHSLSENVGRFYLKDRIFLIPEMDRIGCHLIAGAFRGFGIKAMVMETYKGVDLGLEYSSGKECYPCQVTLGDILYFMKLEKEKLGADLVLLEAELQSRKSNTGIE